MKQLFIMEYKTEIKQPSDLFKSIKRINIDYKQENLILICLNTKNNILKKEIIFIGGLNACLVDPKVIFRKALKNNSSSIIIAHNHPSGILEPSTEDINLFKVLKQGGNLLDIKVLDSIIFNKKTFYSLRDSHGE